MLLETAVRLRNLDRLPADPVLRRALFEAWGLHLHNLFQFFHPTAGTPAGGIFAVHYVRDPGRWAKALVPLTARQERRRQVLDSRLAPLNYRPHRRRRGWSEADHQAIASRIRLFIEHLSTARRSWFPKTGRRLSDQTDLLEPIRTATVP